MSITEGYFENGSVRATVVPGAFGDPPGPAVRPAGAVRGSDGSIRDFGPFRDYLVTFDLPGTGQRVNDTIHVGVVGGRGAASQFSVMALHEIVGGGGAYSLQYSEGKDGVGLPFAPGDLENAIRVWNMSHPDHVIGTQQALDYLRQGLVLYDGLRPDRALQEDLRLASTAGGALERLSDTLADASVPPDLATRVRGALDTLMDTDAFHSAVQATRLTPTEAPGVEGVEPRRLATEVASPEPGAPSLS